MGPIDRFYWCLVGAVLLGSSGMLAAQSAASEEHRHSVSASFESLPRIVSADKRRSRGSKNIRALNMAASQMKAYASFDAGQQPPVVDMPLTDGVGSLRPVTGIGGYYWLSAREETTDQVLNLASIAYFSNPGPAPRHLLGTQKSELMITPIRLPREHNHYRSGDSERFQVRYQSQPLASAEVWFMTSMGTETVHKTNPDGLVTIHFPDDFPAPDAAQSEHANHGRLSNQFVLMTHLNTDGKTLISAFNYDYQPGPFRGKSRTMAIGFLLLGLLLAAPLVYRRKKGA